MTSQTTVIFDVGAVLLDWNPRYLYRKLFGGDERAMEAFLRDVCTPTWNNQQDAGRPFADAVAILIDQFPEHADLIRAYDVRWEEMVPGPFPDTVAILRSLKAQGTPLYALTNFAADKFALMRQRYDFFDDFEGIVVSAEAGHVKPDPEIYRILLRRYGLDAASCLFIDDKAANIETAEALGMSGIIYHSSPQLRETLEAQGLLSPAAVVL